MKKHPIKYIAIKYADHYVLYKSEVFRETEYTYECELFNVKTQNYMYNVNIPKATWRQLPDTYEGGVEYLRQKINKEIERAYEVVSHWWTESFKVGDNY